MAETYLRFHIHYTMILDQQMETRNNEINSQTKNQKHISIQIPVYIIHQILKPETRKKIDMTIKCHSYYM